MWSSLDTLALHLHRGVGRDLPGDRGQGAGRAREEVAGSRARPVEVVRVREDGRLAAVLESLPYHDGAPGVLHLVLAAHSWGMGKEKVTEKEERETETEKVEEEEEKQKENETTC